MNRLTLAFVALFALPAAASPFGSRALQSVPQASGVKTVCGTDSQGNDIPGALVYNNGPLIQHVKVFDVFYNTGNPPGSQHVAISYQVAERRSGALDIARQAALVIGASLFVAVCAHIYLPLPGTPVPLTVQNLAVLLVGLSLGSRRGFLAMALYLAEGASGLPVFSPTGPGGIAQLIGPTAGYLIAYPFVAALAGFIFERGKPTFPRSHRRHLGRNPALCQRDLMALRPNPFAGPRHQPRTLLVHLRRNYESHAGRRRGQHLPSLLSA